MDITTPIIFVGIFIIACLSLFLVFKFGIKEKSYEEALAEQRQQTNALLGVKAKPKEKKSKKNAKKPKEKQQPSENDVVEETVDAPHHQHHQKLHVAFKSEPEELVPKESSPVKRPIKKEKVRPILVHKELNEQPVNPVMEVTESLNHFEIIHPKDAVELLRSNSKEDLIKTEPPKEVKEKPSKEKKQPDEATKTKKSKHVQIAPEPTPVVENIEKKEEKKEVAAPPTNGLTVNTAKEKKKKKSEFNTLQQLTAERDGLFTLVRRAELSRNEIQTLIELLLNKQHEAPTVVDDWSEGKSDPVQKLKKQLADKEKLLADEQETLAGMQAKLREIRGEQQAERSGLNQKIRTLEEALANKNVEIDSGNNRLQTAHQKMQILQGQLNEEVGKTQKILEENQALQHQVKQQEMRLVQGQEVENHALIQLRAEFQALQVEAQRLSVDNASLIENQQSRMNEIGGLQLEVEQLKMINKQLEETRQGLEQELINKIRTGDDMLKEISHLKSSLHLQAEETRKTEFTLGQHQHETREQTKLVAQLKEELQKEVNDKQAARLESQRDKDELQKTKFELDNAQIKLQKLTDDFHKLQSAQINGSAEETKNHKVELLNLNNQLSSIQNELQQTKVKLTETDGKNQSLEKEIEEQKLKNNDLRQKNWKVMEALNIAESRNKNVASPKRSDVSLDVLTKTIITKEQDSQKQFIQRLFPEIEGVDSAVTSDDWQVQVGDLIQNYVHSLKNKQTSTVESPDLIVAQTQVAKYKSIIDETEGQLIHLQNHIAEEEMNWRNQLAEKDAEIVTLKEGATLQLKAQLQEQEKKLTQEQIKYEALNREHQQLRGRSQNADAATTIERLTEEVNRLNELLRLEQSKKNGDVNGSSKEQNFKATNGLSCIEHSLSSSSASLASSEVIHNKKPKNKKKKKKGNGN